MDFLLSYCDISSLVTCGLLRLTMMESARSGLALKTKAQRMMILSIQIFNMMNLKTTLILSAS